MVRKLMRTSEKEVIDQAADTLSVRSSFRGEKRRARGEEHASLIEWHAIGVLAYVLRRVAAALSRESSIL